MFSRVEHVALGSDLYAASNLVAGPADIDVLLGFALVHFKYWLCYIRVDINIRMA